MRKILKNLWKCFGKKRTEALLFDRLSQLDRWRDRDTHKIFPRVWFSRKNHPLPHNVRSIIWNFGNFWNFEPTVNNTAAILDRSGRFSRLEWSSLILSISLDRLGNQFLGFKTKVCSLRWWATVNVNYENSFWICCDNFSGLHDNQHCRIISWKDIV